MSDSMIRGVSIPTTLSETRLRRPSVSLTQMHKSESHSILYRPVLFRVFQVLSVIALSISGYLAWTAFQANEVYGCGGGEIFDCGHVLTSQYSKIFGLPVSVPAFALYASLISVLFFMRSNTPEKILTAGWSILTFGAVSAGLAALWFIGIQVFVLKHLCAYCLAAHSCGLFLTAAVLWYRPLGIRTTSLLSGVAAGGIAIMVAAQVTAEPPQTFVVERFDEMPASEDVAFEFDAPVDFDAPIDFAPPIAVDDESAEAGSEFGTVFAPPTDVPPLAVETVFEPPVIADDVRQPSPTESPVSSETADDAKAVKPTAASAPEPAKADVTNISAPSTPAASDGVRATVARASMLFISPSAARLTVRFLAAFADESAENPASDADSPDAKVDAETEKKSGDAGGETAAPAPEVAKPEPRLVSVSGNRFRLDSRQWPLLGSPDARYIFVEMFDYTCPHCRNTHRAVHGAMQKYGDDLAIIALPVPLERSCNDTVTRSSPAHANACEFARLSIAVWRVQPSMFQVFHEWLFEGTRSASAARSKAEELVGKSALDAELARPYAGEYISKHVELYKRVGRGSVPKLMFPRSTMTGEVSSVQTLCSTIERELASVK